MLNQNLKPPSRLPDTAIEYVGTTELTLAGGCDDCAAIQTISKSDCEFTFTALVWHAEDCPTWRETLKQRGIQ